MFAFLRETGVALSTLPWLTDMVLGAVAMLIYSGYCTTNTAGRCWKYYWLLVACIGVAGRNALGRLAMAPQIDNFPLYPETQNSVAFDPPGSGALGILAAP